MTPLRITLLVLAILGALGLRMLEVRSDATAIFGAESRELGALNSLSGRTFVIGLAGDGPAAGEAARAVGAMLRADPLIVRASVGPAAPSDALWSFLWSRRLLIAPPAADAMTAEAFAARLRAARAALESEEGALLADYLLRDPTGAFAEAVERMRAMATPLSATDGIWRARDGSGAILFGAFADREEDAAEVAALAARVRETARGAGAAAHIVGPHFVAAEVGQATARASTNVVLAATTLLLLALALCLRSLPAMLATLLPPLFGVAAAALSVQLLYGHVHIVALGFGGALTGLALDYPLHLASHRKTRTATHRLVFLGAGTTAIAFLAMLGADIPALEQTGVFVAIGLLSAAFVATRLPGPARDPAVPDIRLPLPRFAAPAVAGLGALILLVAPQAPPERMIPPPETVKADAARLGAMLDLPSGRFEIRTEAATLEALFARQARLRPALDRAVEKGVIAGYDAIALATAPAPETPPPAVFEEALRRAGLDPAFAATQRRDYEAALNAPPLTLDDLGDVPEFAALAARIEKTDAGLRATTRLYGAPPDAVSRIGPPPEGSVLVDLGRLVEDGLAELRAQTLFWLGLGAAGAVGLLLLALRDLALVARVALPAAAGALAAAAAMTVIGGGLSVFQIVALTLLVGIGVDYGLISTHARGHEQRADARRSVILCATSTLIAFGVMALSGAAILREIGLTVTIGVIIVAGLSLVEGREDEE
ncbi:MAG: MMPL family transporter [Pikeienuella sp.]